MKRMFILLSVIIIFIITVTICILNDKPTKYYLSDVKDHMAEIDYETKNPTAVIEIEKYGDVVIELYKDIAPNTVNNFINLSLEGFYDNNNFHRLMKGFVLQGGDPNGIGNGGPGYTIKGEFSSNDFENNLKHTEGIISMARQSNGYDTAGSQFFIMLGEASYLDGNYAAFGKVVKGMDIIKKIEQNAVVADTETGKLQNNIKIKTIVIDLNNNEIEETIKIVN